jgi:group I intron endonuclease
MIGIYCIENLLDGKRYIGQSIDVIRRIRDHKYLMKKGAEPNKHLKMSCKKYGFDNFRFSILATCPMEELDELEREFIFLYKTMDDRFGYNLTDGGNSNKVVSEETKKLFSIINRRPCSEEAKRKLSEAHKGKKHSLGHKMPESAKKKLSDYWKGKPQSKELIAKRSKALLGNKCSLGQKHSAEHRRKITETRRARGGYAHSEETKRKISEAKKGKFVVISEEGKKRRAEGIHRYWAQKKKEAQESL